MILMECALFVVVRTAILKRVSSYQVLSPQQLKVSERRSSLMTFAEGIGINYGL